ncbi:MAG TPA: STAS domain-containing protein [Streptosporangiaceae bacterium]
MPGIELETSARDGHVVVALRGELDVSGAAGVEAAITAAVVPGQSLIIDMSALDFMDCASPGALLRVQELARSGGGDVVLAAPPRRARRLLVLSGQDQAFWVHASVQAAVVSIGSRRTLYPVPGPAVSTGPPGRAAPLGTGTG